MGRFSVFVMLVLSGCVASPTERALSVREVVQNAPGLDGREILVTGWIEYCWRLSCPLFESAADVWKDDGYFLSIGSSRGFDAFAAPQAPARVTFRARVHDRCISDPATGTIAACADRAGTLEPIGFDRPGRRR